MRLFQGGGGFGGKALGGIAGLSQGDGHAIDGFGCRLRFRRQIREHGSQFGDGAGVVAFEYLLGLGLLGLAFRFRSCVFAGLPQFFGQLLWPGKRPVAEIHLALGHGDSGGNDVGEPFIFSGGCHDARGDPARGRSNAAQRSDDRLLVFQDHRGKFFHAVRHHGGQLMTELDSHLAQGGVVGILDGLGCLPPALKCGIRPSRAYLHLVQHVRKTLPMLRREAGDTGERFGRLKESTKGESGPIGYPLKRLESTDKALLFHQVDTGFVAQGVEHFGQILGRLVQADHDGLPFGGGFGRGAGRLGNKRQPGCHFFGGDADQVRGLGHVADNRYQFREGGLAEFLDRKKQVRGFGGVADLAVETGHRLGQAFDGIGLGYMGCL